MLGGSCIASLDITIRSLDISMGLADNLRRGACRLSYVEGRLKLAEKERQRALKAKEAVPEDGVSQEELAALNAKADANMAALLQEEAALKVYCTGGLLSKMAQLGAIAALLSD